MGGNIFIPWHNEKPCFAIALHCLGSGVRGQQRATLWEICKEFIIPSGWAKAGLIHSFVSYKYSHVTVYFGGIWGFHWQGTCSMALLLKAFIWLWCLYLPRNFREQPRNLFDKHPDHTYGARCPWGLEMLIVLGKPAHGFQGAHFS